MADSAPDIQYVKGVGPERVKTLAKLGIESLFGLVHHFPRDWVDRSKIKKLSQIRPGEKETIEGSVLGVESRRVKARLNITKVLVQDDTGYITAVWYNQPYMAKNFARGDRVIMHGKVELYGRQLQMPVPEYEVIDDESDGKDALNVNRIVPIYPLTEGVSQKQFRKIMRAGLDKYLQNLSDPVPPQALPQGMTAGLAESLESIHFPQSKEILEQAKARLKFDEFFYLMYAFELKRRNIKELSAKKLAASGSLFSKFSAGLPFRLTGAQERVIEEIKKDMASGKPMNRLVQGDVGSGKTVVALHAALMAIDSGSQAAIMAPTELLAEQHARSIGKMLAGTGVTVQLLTSAGSKKAKAAALKAIEEGDAGIVVGTHALIQDDVKFRDLALAVIDEQHRFGVLQRAKLMEKAPEGLAPHSLIMTATPIPRTLSLCVYGDTDVSVIDELPPGRKAIKTVVFSERERAKLFSFLEKPLSEGAQIYAVYPLVDDSEKVDLKSAIAMEELWAAHFKKYRTAIVHGRMKKPERDAVMDAFKKGEIDILVATTVIEVGIDIPNASIMVVEHAERFGLSQLHQLRGRVGRGERQSFCVLIGDPRTEEAQKRLKIMADTTDGFKISEEDLALRGPGEFLGERQHGLPEFKIANIIWDRRLLEQAKESAKRLVSGNCDLNHIQKKALFDTIKAKYRDNLNLINIA